MSKDPKVIVVAVGGNAILREGQTGKIEEQVENITTFSGQIVKLLRQGHRLVLTHGNGPQVGHILLRNLDAKKYGTHPMPLDVCGAESQGQIGYLIQQGLRNRFRREKLDQEVVAIITQVLVDRKDPAFDNPTKPIGPWLSKEQVMERDEDLSLYSHNPELGYRRLIASPDPVEILDLKLIKSLVADGKLVIAAGGGGIPVWRGDDGATHGVEVVIDKDYSSSLIATDIKADIFMILTEVERVALNFGKPDMAFLDQITVQQAHEYLDQGQFPAGSMGPKIKAAVKFVQATGGKAVITSLANASLAVQGRAGTTIAKSFTIPNRLESKGNSTGLQK